MTGTLVKLGQALGGAILGLVTGSNQGVNRLLRLRYAVLWAMATVGSLGGVFAFLHVGLGSLWSVGARMLLWATLALFQELRAKADPRPATATANTNRQRID